MYFVKAESKESAETTAIPKKKKKKSVLITKSRWTAERLGGRSWSHTALPLWALTLMAA